MQKRTVLSPIVLVPCLYFLSACHSPATEKNFIAEDSATIAAGETSFNKNCSGCHNFKQDGIGPSLSGLTAVMPVDSIRLFIKNSQQLIASGDERIQAMYLKFKKAVMPSFALGDEELNAIIAFLHTHRSPATVKKKKGNEISNPLPAPIALSNLVVNLKPFVQIPASNDSAPKARITKLSFQPATNNLFIVDLRGKLYKMKQGQPVVYMDMARLKPKFINQPGLATGFGSFAFHPAFANNGLLYTTHTEAPGSGKADFAYADSIKVTVQWVLTEWKVSQPGADTLSGTSRELLRVNMVTGIHGVQEIIFNPLSKPGDQDYGLLYIGVGDGGSVENGYGFLAHNIEKAWGTVFRINPAGRNSTNGQYGIPDSNPFVHSKNARALKEIYAYGFRNPHRITWTKKGLLLVSNIGQANIESLNLLEPGHDYGWPIREGKFVSSDLDGNLGSLYPLPADDSIFHITYPVAQFDHDEGLAISGGFEYAGKSIPQLQGKFLFGDIPSGRLFYIDIDSIHQGKQAVIKEWKILINNAGTTLKQACGSDRVDLHFGRDREGEIYILTKADGKIYKLANVVGG